MHWRGEKEKINENTNKDVMLNDTNVWSEGTSRRPVLTSRKGGGQQQQRVLKVSIAKTATKSRSAGETWKE